MSKANKQQGRRAMSPGKEGSPRNSCAGKVEVGAQIGPVKSQHLDDHGRRERDYQQPARDQILPLEIEFQRPQNGNAKRDDYESCRLQTRQPRGDLQASDDDKVAERQ